MRLRYIGPEVPIGAALPLPQGWDAADHDEPDEATADAKVASGLYAGPPKAKAEKEEGVQ